MNIITFDYGHMIGGQDTSAIGILNEYKVVREYGKVVVDVLTRAGYNLVDCTPKDNTNLTMNQSLQYRVDKANENKGLLHLCFHANAFSDASAFGAECEISSETSRRYAILILNELSKLNLHPRGVNNRNLYVTKNTLSPCVLIEPFFVTNTHDCNLYDPIKIGNAIAKGVLNALGGIFVPVTNNGASIDKDDVLIVQNGLNRIINSKLVIDGIQGDLTTNKVKEFQNDLGFSATGIIDTTIVSAINEILSFPILNIGNKFNYATRYIQFRLKLSKDGVFGNNTKSAVQDYQKSKGLNADGIVGKNTWTELFK